MRYYHGTSTSKAGLSILENGLVTQSHADMGRSGRASLHPVENRTYLTPSLRYGVIYCLGASMLGNEMSQNLIGDEVTGYLFVIDDTDLDLIPDEDELGDVIRTGYRMVQKGEKFHQSMDNPMFAEAISNDPSIAIKLYYLADQYLTARQKEKLYHGYEYDILAIAGKKILKVMTQDWKDKLVSMGCHASASNHTIIPSEAWAFDKRKSASLDYHGKNFFELARRIR